ncbi:hypothetical protein Btru_036376 [Bulinus truncatus]|nr:hypothetical protein Btru_036376 [Bulinus truncatus]
MERGRVVHWAKTKTSEVLSPSATKRHPSSPDDETRHAPLALGEADVYLPTIRLTDQILQDKVRGGLCLDPENFTATASTCPSKTSLYRVHGTIQQMVHQDRPDMLHIPNNSLGGLSDETRLKKAASGRKIYPGPVVTVPTSSPPPGRTELKSQFVSQTTSGLVPGMVQGKSISRNSVMGDVQMTTTYTKANGGYIKQTVISNVTSPLDIKPDHTTPLRQSPISSGFNLPVSVTNRNKSLKFSDKDEVDNAGNYLDAKKRHVDKTLVSQIDQEVVKDQKGNNSSDQNKDVVIHWTVNEHNNIICRKLSIRSNQSESETTDDGSSKVNVCETRKLNTSVEGSSVNVLSSMSQQDELYNSDKDSGVQSDNTSQNSNTPISEGDVSPSSPVSKWKRNSLRMAVQGFTSMSDLTNSLECLQLVSQDVYSLRGSAAMKNSSATDNYKETVLQKSPITPTVDDVLYSSNGQIYTFFEQLKKSESPHVTCTKLEENPLNRNEIICSSKRHSYIMATTSNSDLSCVNNEPRGSIVHPNLDLGRLKNDSLSKRVLPHSPRLAREDSICSSPQDSSFGSFYSCQSAAFVSARSSPYLDRNDKNIKPNVDNCVKRSVQQDQVSSSEDESEDASMYCTASDSSFLESQRSYKDSKSNSPKLNTQNMPLMVTARSNKLTSATQSKGFSPRSFKKFSPVLQCYGCGVERGHSAMMVNQTHRKIDDSKRNKVSASAQRIVSNVNRCTDPRIKAVTRMPENRNRCKSIPVIAVRNFDRNRLGEINHIMDDSFSLSESESDWSEMPTSPPALGRPKRKVYAGFDSQPLPMDSFMSDSSSCYTDCGSWSSRATSKSAEVERSYHGSIENLTSNIRSASAEAIDTITPTRQMSQDTLLEFFRLNGKEQTVCENNHNVFISMENYDSSEKLKGSYEAKTFSNESLHSNLSTATTTSYSHGNNSQSDTSKYGVDDEVRYNYKRQNDLDIKGKLNNEMILNDGAMKLSAEFKLRNSQEFLNNSWGNSREDVRVQQKQLKAASSASMSRPQFHSRRKYLSSKDIIDLLVTSEKRVQGPGSSSLEKQAQKVCRVILCCNDMEASIHSGQYQF